MTTWRVVKEWLVVLAVALTSSWCVTIALLGMREFSPKKKQLEEASKRSALGGRRKAFALSPSRTGSLDQNTQAMERHRSLNPSPLWKGGDIGQFSGLPVLENRYMPRDMMLIVHHAGDRIALVEHLPTFRVRIGLHYYLNSRMIEINGRLGLPQERQHMTEEERSRIRRKYRMTNT